MLLDSLFKDNQTQAMQYAKFMDNSMPLFSQSGRNIYASDIVQMCIDCIATECSKLRPQHIRRDNEGKLIQLPSSDNLNRLLKYRPNPLMTTRDYIEKVIWSLFLNYNTFIYPSYEISTDSRGGTSRYYTGLWPLSPTQVEWLSDATGRLYVKFSFQNGQPVTLPYSDVIHLRKKYSLNDIMGGGANGQPDNKALLQTIQINDTILQGTAKSVQISLGARGILKLNTSLDDGKNQKEKETFIQQAMDGTGILVQDFKGDFTPLDIKPTSIDSATLAFIENKILRWFGVSLPILNGDFNDEQYQAFYNKTLEPVVVTLEQAHTSVIFTETQQAYNNEIVFFPQRLELMDVKNKIAILDGLGNRGAMTNNQLLDLFGLPPYEGGDVRMASLNYINADLADAYQMARAKANQQSDGGKTNGEK